MKTIKITIAILTFLFMSETSFAQEEEKSKTVQDYKNQFFILPTALFTKTIQFGYERKTTKNTSLMLQLGMYSNNENVLDDQRVSGNGYRAEVSFNIFSKDLVKGDNGALHIYFSPYVNHFTSSFKIGKDYYNSNYTYEYSYEDFSYSENFTDSITEDGSGELSHTSLGATIGIRWTLSKVLVFDFYHGGGAQLANYVGDNKFKRPLKNETFFSFANTGIVGKVGLRVGLLF